MSSISKVVVVQHDPRAASAVRLGFEREGATVLMADDAAAAAAMFDDTIALVVAGAEGVEPARALLGALKGKSAAPLLWVGNGVRREEAWASGADEVLPQPAYLRDVVTIGKLLSGRKRGTRTTINGDLGDYFGVFYMVRALAATGRSGVLTLVRGLRRGEMRLFEGEVTSAHMGGLHGQAGFHQLLLWTEARFEWRHEPVVRRQQLPLPHEEVLGQAAKFLHEIRIVSGGLSPAAVYEQDAAKIQAMARKLPTEVHGVLRLFDGNRTMADILEDSSFRVFETLRVALRAVETGLLRQVETTRPKAAMRAVLAVEEWLVGGESRDAVIDRTMETIPDSAPHPKVPAEATGGKGSGKKKNKGRAKRGKDSGPSRVVPPEVDWAALVPRSQTVDMSGVSGVIPAAQTSGEIVTGEPAIAARREGREGLEALTDAEERSRMFPALVSVDLGPDPDATPEPAPPETPAPEVPSEPEPQPEIPAPAPDAPEIPEPEDPKPEIAPPEVPKPEHVEPEIPQPADPMPSPTPIEIPAPEPSGDVISALAAVAAVAPVADDEAEWRALARQTQIEHPEPTEPIPKEELDPPAVVVEPTLLGVPPALGAEPAMLAVDLAFAQAAVAVVAEREAVRPVVASAPPHPDVRDPATSAEISAVRMDAVAVATAFSDDEEEFFNAGKTLEKTKPIKPESFDDLDAGYKPESFWERLRGKRDTKKP